MEEETQSYQSKRSLEINPSEKFLMGVCEAFGNFINVNPVFIRIIVLTAFFFLGQSILIIYSAFGILLPVNENRGKYSRLNSNTITLNLLFIIGIVLLFLLYNDMISIKTIFAFLSQKIDAFTLLVFSIALLINNHYKVEVNMPESEIKEIRKSDRKLIFGICAGFGEYLNINPNLVRLIWVIFFFASFGLAAIVYLVLNFIIPAKSKDGFANE